MQRRQGVKINVNKPKKRKSYRPADIVSELQ